MRFRPLTTEAEWNWFISRNPIKRMADVQGIVAYNDDGEISGIVCFDNFRYGTCTPHFATDTLLGIRDGALSYAMEYLRARDTEVMIAIVADVNPKAIRIAKKLGWKEVAQVPDMGGIGIGATILRATVDDVKHALPVNQKEAA